MSIPDYQTIMLPLLKVLSDGMPHKTKEVIESLARVLELSDSEKQEVFAGGQPVFNNRVGWARTYLKKASLISSPSKGVLVLSNRGKELLSTNPIKINNVVLKQYPEFLEFMNFKRKSGDAVFENENNINEIQTPDEIIESAYLQIRQSLIQELLEKIKSMSPVFFEKLVIELLVKMGYGGSLEDAGKATKLTNDEGIDGTIKEDKLGLDVIYIQAKRWNNNSVGRPDIQSFVGALDGQRANKGIFITTSSFAKTAMEYVKTISKKVILIDGQQLAGYMIDYGLGVSTIQTYELKRTDSDYFEE
jgi:restriction system protein